MPLPPVDDRRKVQEDVDKDRKHAIEAAIVRIMKARRRGCCRLGWAVGAPWAAEQGWAAAASRCC